MLAPLYEHVIRRETVEQLISYPPYKENQHRLSLIYVEGQSSSPRPLGFSSRFSANLLPERAMATQEASHSLEPGAAAVTLDSSLPPEETQYTVTEVHIPMLDGIQLAADLYKPDLPEGAKPHGLVYVLGPYGRGPVMAALLAQSFAARGYLVLFASSRGTGGSEGTFVPAMTEQADSQVVVKWMREQPWYPGKFVTFGPSYMGYVQWALLRDPPEDLIASIILCSTFDHSSLSWTNGAYRLDRISWSYLVANQDQTREGQARQMISASASKLRAVMEATPILDAAERLFDGKAPYIRKFMTTPNINDPFWAPCKHSAAIDLVNVPILLRTGWYDTLTVQTMGAYIRLRDRGQTVYLTIGPWTHIEASGREALPEVFKFLDEHVAGRPKDHYRPLPVKVFATGAEEWRFLPSWPPATEERVFYLHGDGAVDTQRPAADSPSASFTFNPADPTPTMGGPLLARGGRVDDSAYASRSDLLVYTSAPLTEEIEIMGRPIVELTHSTDIPYADLWVRLSEIDADGVSHNLNENWQALDGVERQDGTISLTLTDRAHVFKKKTCIRVIVAGGSFPLIARNPGTGVNRTQAAELRPVTHTVQHGDGISKLILPCSR